MEAWIVQFHGQGVLEIDTAAHRLGCLPIRQIEQKLQHADRGQLSWRETRTPITWVPIQEILVAPQPVQPILHPHRSRTARIARPRNLRGQRRNLLPRTETNGQRAPRQLHRPVNKADHATDQVPHHETKITDRVKLGRSTSRPRPASPPWRTAHPPPAQPAPSRDRRPRQNVGGQQDPARAQTSRPTGIATISTGTIRLYLND